jgi:hypothetical protein
VSNHESGRPGVTSGAGIRQPVPLEAPRVPVAELPWSYDDDRVVLMARDPRTLFVYWDLHPQTIASSEAGLDGPRPLLRLTLLDGTPVVLRDLEIDLGWRGYYLHGLEPERAYRVELLVSDERGTERLLAHASNSMLLPPNAPSRTIDDRFVRLAPNDPLPEGGVHAPHHVVAETAMHARAFELSGGDGPIEVTGDAASSLPPGAQGFHARPWSGTLSRP